MDRKRAHVVLQVQIDLDDIPGANHYGEDTQRYVQYLLNTNIPHYNPVVTMISNDRSEIPPALWCADAVAMGREE